MLLFVLISDLYSSFFYLKKTIKKKLELYNELKKNNKANFIVNQQNKENEKLRMEIKTNSYIS